LGFVVHTSTGQRQLDPTNKQTDGKDSTVFTALQRPIDVGPGLGSL